MMYGNPPPERIYGWMQSHLSIARFYGGCKFQGHTYSIDMTDPQHPLVRQDVLMRDAKARKQAKAEAAKAEQDKQQELL
jgi:hypothetical protein